MIRRILVLFAVLAASVVLAAPASASDATTFTQNVHGTLPPMVVGPMCGAPGGTITGTGNFVMHVTVNGAGDVWVTATQEEWFTLVQSDSTLPTFSGHFAVWFGVSLNKNNVVTHDIFNILATGSDGSTLTLHLVDHFSVSASGQVNMFPACG